MNKAILMGRLTRDPEIRHTTGDSPIAIARYTLAVDRRFRRDSENEQTADFISCVAFRSNAEFAEKYFRQGIKIVIEGRIQTGSYTDKEGRKIYTTEVVVEHSEFAESKKTQETSASGRANSAQTSSAGGIQQEDRGHIPDDGFMNIPDGIDEELPFN